MCKYHLSTHTNIMRYVYIRSLIKQMVSVVSAWAVNLMQSTVHMLPLTWSDLFSMTIDSPVSGASTNCEKGVTRREGWRGNFFCVKTNIKTSATSSHPPGYRSVTSWHSCLPDNMTRPSPGLELVYFTLSTKGWSMKSGPPMLRLRTSIFLRMA